MPLDELYLKYISLTNSDENNDSEKRRLLESMNEHYFNDNNIQLDINSGVDVEKLISYVASKCRYSVLSYLVKGCIDDSCKDADGKENEFIRLNMVPIIDGIYEELFKKLQEVKTINLKNHSVLSKERVNAMVIDLLGKIDPTMRCTFKFTELCYGVMGDGILYLNELSSDDQNKLLAVMNSAGVIDEGRTFTVNLNDGRRFLVLDYTGNYHDITSTIHELGHYLFPIENNSLPLVREFSSIFYELYALNTMIDNNDGRLLMGTDKMDDLIGKIDFTALIRLLIKAFLSNGNNVTKEKMEEALRNEIVSSGLNVSFKFNNRNIKINEENLHEYLDILCDYLTILLINMKKYGISMDSFNQYVVGAYLAICAMESVKKGESLSRILECSYNMSKMKFYDIFTGANVPVDKLGIVDPGTKEVVSTMK